MDGIQFFIIWVASALSLVSFQHGSITTGILIAIIAGIVDAMFIVWKESK